MTKSFIAASLAIVVGAGSHATAAGPPGGLNVREQNVDGSGAIRVHEQGTANVNVTNSSLPVAVQNLPGIQDVRVTNSPLGVNGTVNVGNLPLDASGAVRVTAPLAAGQAFLMGENLTIAASGLVTLSIPFADTSACHSLTALVAMNAERASTVVPDLEISPDGAVPFFGAAGKLNPPTTAAQNGMFHYLVDGTSVPIAGPFARIRRLINQVNRPVTVNEIWLSCAP
jgi:hypothetical protein